MFEELFPFHEEITFPQILEINFILFIALKMRFSGIKPIRIAPQTFPADSHDQLRRQALSFNVKRAIEGNLCILELHLEKFAVQKQ